MRKAHSSARPGPEGLRPVGASITVRLAKMYHKELLHPSGKCLHADFGDIILEIVINTVGRHIREVLEMRILRRRNGCQTRHQKRKLQMSEIIFTCAMRMADIGWNTEAVKRKITPSLEVVANCRVHRKFVGSMCVGLGKFDEFGISGQLCQPLAMERRAFKSIHSEEKLRRTMPRAASK